MGVYSYRDLKVWQSGIDAAEQVYRLTSIFPKRETYGLCSQMERSATSIPANIAEGHARESTKDYLRYLSIAQGSRAELETHLILAGRLHYGEKEQINRLLEQVEEIGRMLRGLQRSLKAKL